MGGRLDMLYELIKSIVFGIVEGVTEWLPISSTGHMILLDRILPLNVSSGFMEMFLVVIQLGAILAVVVLYWKKLCPISLTRRVHIKRETCSLWLKIGTACVPAAVIGLLFGDQIDALFYNYQTVAAALIVYGILFIAVERRNGARAERIDDLKGIDYKTALFIGIFQLLALIPGTSRSGATILGAILVGASRTVAAEFTFFLAVPVMLGASLLKLVKFGLHFTAPELAILLTGALAAFLVSMAAIRFLTNFVKRHDFKAFGWYRIALGATVLAFFLFAG